MTIITSPYALFTATDGTALDAGKIYIGTAGLDPRSNPIPVYWDEARTIPAAQPVRTVAGAPTYQGTPSNIYTSASAYSLIVQDKNGVLIYQNLNATGPITTAALAGTTSGLGAEVVGFIQSGAGAIAQTVAGWMRKLIHQSDYGTYSQAKTAAGNTKLLVASPQTNTGFTGAKTRPGVVTGHMVIGDSDAFKLEPDAFVGLLAHESYFGNILQEMRGISYSIDYGRNTLDEPVLGWDVIPVLGATRVTSANSFDLLGNMKAIVGELIFDKPNSGTRTIRNAYNLQATTYVEENITLTNWYGCVIGEPIHNGAVGGTITNGFGLLINNLAGGSVTFTNVAAIRLAGTGNAGRIWWGNSTWITQDTGSKLEISLNGAQLVLTNALTATTVGAAGAGAALPATPSGYWRVIIGGTPFKIPYYAD